MSWSLHWCRWNPVCRSSGAPNRVSLTTPWFYLGVALTPAARYAGLIKEPWLSALQEVPPGRDVHLVARRRAIVRRAERGRGAWTDLRWRVKGEQ